MVSSSRFEVEFRLPELFRVPNDPLHFSTPSYSLELRHGVTCLNQVDFFLLLLLVVGWVQLSSSVTLQAQWFNLYPWLPRPSCCFISLMKKCSFYQENSTFLTCQLLFWHRRGILFLFLGFLMKGRPEAQVWTSTQVSFPWSSVVIQTCLWKLVRASFLIGSCNLFQGRGVRNDHLEAYRQLGNSRIILGEKGPYSGAGTALRS